MLRYNPEDATIKLVDPDGNDKSFFKDEDEDELDVEGLHERLSDSVDLVANQARQACSCPEETKGTDGKTETGAVEVCLPCEARGTINAFLSVASQG